MKVYEIERELEGRRAVIKGPYADLNVDDEVIIKDYRGVLYDAVVCTRVLNGAVVVVKGVLVD